MREILFRGKAIDVRCNERWIGKGEWVYGFYHYTNWYNRLTKELVETHYWILPVDSQDGCQVDPSTVGQYTGLRDAENKRIFDGDILLHGNKHLVVWWNGEAFQWQAKEKQEVTCTFDGKKQAVVWDNIDLGWIAAEVPISGKMTTKVIGNIYDNPELLEE